MCLACQCVAVSEHTLLLYNFEFLRFPPPWCKKHASAVNFRVFLSIWSNVRRVFRETGCFPPTHVTQKYLRFRALPISASLLSFTSSAVSRRCGKRAKWTYYMHNARSSFLQRTVCTPPFVVSFQWETRDLYTLVCLDQGCYHECELIDLSRGYLTWADTSCKPTTCQESPHIALRTSQFAIFWRNQPMSRLQGDRKVYYKTTTNGGKRWLW